MPVPLPATSTFTTRFGWLNEDKEGRNRVAYRRRSFAVEKGTRDSTVGRPDPSLLSAAQDKVGFFLVSLFIVCRPIPST